MTACPLGQVELSDIDKAREDVVVGHAGHGSADGHLFGGGGGAVVALCPENAGQVAEAMKAADYQAMVAEIGFTPEKTE